MDDMQAIEQRIAREMLRRAGPSEPVDDAAIFAAVTATQSRGWRYQPMFSAMKFVVAGVIVALFGGVVVAGVLTTKPTEPLPAAVAASPTFGPVPTEGPTLEPDPTTETDEQSSDETRDILPGVDLVTEAVAPGVHQVLNDGYRDLSVKITPEWGERKSTPEEHRRSATNLIAGLDGSVWVFGPDEWYRVGQPEIHPVTDDTPGFPGQKAEVDPDGRLWTRVGSEPDSVEPSPLRSFEGDAWTTEREDVVAFDLENDGTVWVNADGRLIRLRDGWQSPQMAREVEDFWMSPVMHGTQQPGDEIEALVQDDTLCDGVACGLVVWVLAAEGGGTRGNPAGLLQAQFDRVDMGEQGDHWIHQRLEVPRAGPGITSTVAPSDTIDYLVHVTGPTFTVYRGPDGVPDLGFAAGGVFRAGPDGSVWVTPQETQGCEGLANFDGETWVRYLEGRCVYGFDFATDGAVWVQAGDAPYAGQEILEEPEPFPVDTYVIRPEAAASTDR